MKKYSHVILVMAALMVTTVTAIAAEPANYYKNALNKSDEALMTALCGIIRNHTSVSYTSGLLSAFRKCDVGADGYIIDIYSDCRYLPSDNGGTASSIGVNYNREHSFPRSWFGGEVEPMNTDIFHIYPTDSFVNEKRGNLPYGVCAGGTTWSSGNYHAKGRSGTCTYPGYRGTVFEPDDEYKGDLARTYFYMVTCYKNELPSWPGSAQLNYNVNRYKAFSTWTINMLMEWTRMDPVSEKEIKRNEAVYGIQGNRNPFIDHPELAEYIWGNKQGVQWTGSAEPVDPVITSPQNGTTIDMGSTVVGTPISHTFTLKGQGLTEALSTSMSDNEYYYVSASTFSADQVNSGVQVTITFTADDEGTFGNTVTIGSDEAATTFTITATATPQGVTPPPAEWGDSIVEDWEGCGTGGYWTTHVQGNAFPWYFNDAGIWSDNLRHGELSCRLGKTSSSSLTMLESVPDATAIGFYAGCFGNDEDAVLSVTYSTSAGSTWYGLGTVTVTKGSLQHFVFEVSAFRPVCFGINQVSGSRVNIDDITIYRKPKQLTGDVNQDGEINIADINTLINIILTGATPDAATMQRADVNDDHEVTIADINVVIDIILNT